MFITDQYSLDHFKKDPKDPFYDLSFHKDGPNDKKLTKFLDEVTENHPADIYNRRLICDLFLSHLNPHYKTYIDIGCGPGFLLRDMKAKMPDIFMVGSDIDGLALTNCHKRLPEIPLLRFDLNQCPVKNDCFDMISCCNVLEHLEDDHAAFNNLFRILRPEGLLAMTVPMGSQLYDIYDEVHRHYRRYDFVSLIPLLQEVGFKVLEYKYFLSSIWPLFYLTKKRNQKKYNNLPYQDKLKMVIEKACKTEKSKILSYCLYLEKKLLPHISFPFGIRGYILAKKSK